MNTNEDVIDWLLQYWQIPHDLDPDGRSEPLGNLWAAKLHCVGRRSCPQPHSSYEYDDDWHFVLEREISGLDVAMLLKVDFQLGYIWMYVEYDDLWDVLYTVHPLVQKNTKMKKSHMYK